MTDTASAKHEDYLGEKRDFDNEKDMKFDDDINLEEEQENSPIEAVRLAVPITDDPTLPVVTFRFWVLSFLFTALGATITQYYFFRSTSGTYSIFFVNLVTYSMGKFMARVLPEKKISVFGYEMSLNPGPFNIKEHALIGIAVSTGSSSAYAIEIVASTDLFLNFRINALGSLLLIITTQSVGYGMAGMLRRYLVYPAEMVWWSNLVQVRVQTYWGSGLIYGALGPARMFAFDGKYWFIYIGFIIGLIVPALFWLLSKKFPGVKWSAINIAIIAQGMGAFPNGYVTGIVMILGTALLFQYYIYKYHKVWWTKYTFILSAALDTGAAFTGLILFLFLGRGISPNVGVDIPSWWANHYVDDNSNYPNAPYRGIDRCGAAGKNWTSGTL
ncbi:hypothetical protein KVV02_000219 [Mortierella alpina]|uniref:Uncharacterized protein n=1 Tax=Mortierella alpina TaxID=64518 RepID=A0A9P8D3E4_MORAP|nr:hypothetical protein KVV02_000219 [Mortierella alpina]